MPTIVGLTSPMPQVDAPTLQKIISKIIETFQGRLNLLSNFLLPYIPTA